jgi:hypothetical protein
MAKPAGMSAVLTHPEIIPQRLARLLRPIANCRDLMAEYLPIRQFNRGSVATDPAYRSGVSNVAAKEGRWISKNDMSSARK